ncbi:Uncharacterised protein [Escherichia coli]|uniref:DUF4752 family protein n=6 Tax=Escherichia coli TaxID=562 RepID=A0A376WRG4_ECOLX|nr:Uncharacterised protein [Escherichia coli]
MKRIRLMACLVNMRRNPLKNGRNRFAKEAASEYRHDNNDRYAPKYRSGTSGWLYIMSRTWRWLGSIFLKQWKKRRKQELRQKALEAFYDAFELSRIEPGTTARIATKGDLMIVMFRQERAEKGESA